MRLIDWNEPERTTDIGGANDTRWGWLVEFLIGVALALPIAVGLAFVIWWAVSL